jgi:hypothetical protein
MRAILIEIRTVISKSECDLLSFVRIHRNSPQKREETAQNSEFQYLLLYCESSRNDHNKTPKLVK